MLPSPPMSSRRLLVKVHQMRSLVSPDAQVTAAVARHQCSVFPFALNVRRQLRDWLSAPRAVEVVHVPSFACSPFS